MADEKQPSALLRRHDQLKRWEESDTNRASDSLSSHNRKVKFQDGCVFLAACSSGDCEEVLRMLEKNADINTANIDGLTALHQACIDDNLDMVEFLVEHSADVDVCDNEGWTPLHATASCGFTEIARYLLRIGANVAAVNNDGDLPFDICEDGEMEALLQEEMDRQGVDADAARSEEENQMLADANKWLSNKSVKEKRHPKTGATALHVACAKGYMKVISVLMQAGSDINAKDCDGWTPLHAAAHWGQEEACKVLAEHMCDMETKNNAGQSAFDVADSEIIKLLEELKTKQATLKDTADVQNEIIQHRGQHQKRRPVTTTITNLDQPDNDPRSSVTRMSGDQKQSVTLKTKERGDPNLIHQTTPESVVEKDPTGKTGSSSEGEGEESSESETEKQNAINNQTSGVKQVHDIPSTTTVEIQKPEMPKIDEKGELGQISNDLDTQNEADKVEISIKDQVPRIERIGDGDNQLTAKEKEQDKVEKESDEKNEEMKESEEKEVAPSPPPKDEGPDKGMAPRREPISRSISAPEPPLPAQEQVPLPNEISKPTNPKEVPSWRAGLRKTGSTSQVTGSVMSKEKDTDKSLARSASSPRLDNNQDKTGNKVSFPPSSISETPDSRSTDRYGSQYGSTGPYRRPTSFTSTSSSYLPAYIPYYSRQQENNERREREKESAAAANSRLTGSTTPTSSSGSSMSSSMSSSSSSNIITSPYSNYQFSKRSYEPPRRDEEAETLRKARAKRARETRRSTQGVTLEDIQQAEKALKDPSKVTSTTTGTTTTTTSSTSGADDKSRVPEAGSQKDSERVPGLESTKKEVSASEDTTVLRRRTLEERRQDDLRSSYRKSRDSVKDYSTDSAYIPRRERNTLSTSDGSSTTSSLNAGSGLTRVSSLRTNRIRNGELESRNEDKDKEERQKDSKDDSQEKSHDMRTVRARRTRKERRSTGIVSYDAKNDKMLTFPIDFCFKDEDEKEEEKEEKKEDKKETEDKSSYRHRGQYSSTSDVGDKYSSRSSYADHYQSTPSLDSNYKKLYEDEKYTTERLRKELERTKKELIEAKAELDRLVKRTEANKAADSNDKREKRALERKLSEMEEELKKMDQLRDDNKRLKEENGALIRVISKLSK
ncbi:protein phosphatase 1 regulatory subunit 12A-like isoform X3 [Mizuhopecten yessoensis]|uniref:protein phosphatase 1 regulatory subunit 12A-like isoform X3 n=1 Tax=Mizuhopecten yessoensis TaxID=6573 RepID=UPI000B45B6A2|nr:protein phosphatase 1 regulatory subunit 12A-like isoform X3 [Mizuhopecten yessoensis]